MLTLNVNGDFFSAREARFGTDGTDDVLEVLFVVPGDGVELLQLTQDDLHGRRVERLVPHLDAVDHLPNKLFFVSNLKHQK